MPPVHRATPIEEDRFRVGSGGSNFMPDEHPLGEGHSGETNLLENSEAHQEEVKSSEEPTQSGEVTKEQCSPGAPGDQLTHEVNNEQDDNDHPVSTHHTETTMGRSECSEIERIEPDQKTTQPPSPTTDHAPDSGEKELAVAIPF